MTTNNTRYSPVGPIAWLEDLLQHDVLGDYLLLLAHDVLEHPQRYRDIVEYLDRIYRNPFIILDNSVVELGDALPASHMKEACDIVQPSCVVLPDIIGNATDTVRASVHGLDAYKKAGIIYPKLAIIQGTSVPELAWCAQQLAVMVKPRYWGLPRAVANQLGTRKVFTSILGLNHLQMYPNVHLFGMSQNFQDDIACCYLQGVMGIDSANPLVLGQQGVIFTDFYMQNRYQHVERDSVWGTTELNPIALHNIDYVRKALAQS